MGLHAKPAAQTLQVEDTSAENAPLGHGVQVVDKGPENVPATHAVWLVEVHEYPCSHAVQTNAPLCEYVPFTQGTGETPNTQENPPGHGPQATDPADENALGGHRSGPKLELAQNEPASHTVHTVAPVNAKDPARHGVGAAVVLGHAVPAGQVVHVNESPPRENVPDGHGVGAPEPQANPAGQDAQAVDIAAENIIDGQATGADTVSAQYEPAGQSRQEVTLPPSDTVPGLHGMGRWSGSKHDDPAGQGRQAIARSWL